ncbi:hypothetical protein [Gimesia panareensis]|nr:hypothetical protein [Gimesia panareensis]
MIVLLGVSIPIVMIFYTAAKSFLLDQPYDPFQTFELPHGRTLTLYAEYEWFYEPPGHLYFDVVEDGKVLVEARDFWGVGPERIPELEYKAVTSNDGNLVAILYQTNVVILHDFKTNRTWPGPEGKKWNETDFTWDDYVLLRELLDQFAAEGKTLYCSLLGENKFRIVCSSDYRYHIRREWEKREGVPGFQLRVRLFKEETELETLFETEYRPVKTKKKQSLQDRFDQSRHWGDWNSGWKAGWLDANTFAVWNQDQGARAWKTDAEGNCTELPAPLEDKMLTRIQRLPGSPWLYPAASELKQTSNTTE